VAVRTEIHWRSTRNADLPEANPHAFASASNAGDVVVDGDNLNGDGVNVRGALGGMASPGGIMHLRSNSRAVSRSSFRSIFWTFGESHGEKHRPACARVCGASCIGELKKSPFRGLDVFDFESADLFFRAFACHHCLHREAGAAGCQRQGRSADLME